MNLTAMFIAGMLVLPAVGLVTRVWFAMAQVEKEMQSFSGYEGIHFEI